MSQRSHLHAGSGGGWGQLLLSPQLALCSLITTIKAKMISPKCTSNFITNNENRNKNKQKNTLLISKCSWNKKQNPYGSLQGPAWTQPQAPSPALSHITPLSLPAALVSSQFWDGPRSAIPGPSYLEPPPLRKPLLHRTRSSSVTKPSSLQDSPLGPWVRLWGSSYHWDSLPDSLITVWSCGNGSPQWITRTRRKSFPSPTAI